MQKNLPKTDLASLRKYQEDLKAKLSLHFPEREIRVIAGVDVSFNKTSGELGAAFVLLGYPELKVLGESLAKKKEHFPYISTYLAFRELPVMLEAYKKLPFEPDLILVDGQGIAHPRALGIATHLGIELQVSTIGCAKTHLYGEYTLPAEERGATSPLYINGTQVGAVVRTKTLVKPLFVSPGHLIDIPRAIQYVLETTKKTRLPEPIRLAHLKAKSIMIH